MLIVMSHLGGMILSSSRHEKQKVRLDVTGEDLLGGVLAEVDHQGERVAGHKGSHALLGHIALHVVPALVKVLEDHDASGLVLSKHCCLGGDAKGIVVHVAGSRQECLGP